MAVDHTYLYWYVRNVYGGMAVMDNALLDGLVNLRVLTYILFDYFQGQNPMDYRQWLSSSLVGLINGEEGS